MLAEDVEDESIGLIEDIGLRGSGGLFFGRVPTILESNRHNIGPLKGSGGCRFCRNQGGNVRIARTVGAGRRAHRSRARLAMAPGDARWPRRPRSRRIPE